MSSLRPPDFSKNENHIYDVLLGGVISLLSIQADYELKQQGVTGMVK